MGNTSLPLIFLFGCFTTGFCLQCYKCFEKSKVCNYGRTDQLGVLNCSSPDEVCATFQYETDDSNRVYTTTIRGCQSLTKEGICNQLMTKITSKVAKNTVKKGIFCETCNTDLCNSCSKFKAFIPLIILLLTIACKMT